MYDLGTRLDSIDEIEGALEEFKQQALPELTAELLSEAQAAAVAEEKKEATGSVKGDGP